jgi:MSHA biogenesis protein MshQ
VHFPFLFARLSARALQRRAARILLALLAALLAGGSAQAATTVFNGAPIPPCTLLGRSYTCPDTPWRDRNDAILIGNGYTVNGNLDSASSITINNRATVNGNLHGDVITTGSSVKINGKVTAATSLGLGAGSRLTGSVDTGSLVLESPDTLVDGPALVETARLEWHSRVSGTITCRSGTAANQCDCVTNNSGYPVDSAPGPICDSAPPKGVHHYLITHDGQANSCALEPVTVTACANAACSAPHVADAPAVNLGPGGGLVGFGSSGMADAGVTSIQAGTIILALATTVPVACADLAGQPAACTMAVSDNTAFEIVAPDHRAGEVQAPTLQALKPANNRKSCVPAFRNATVDVAFSCAHVRPSSGRDYLHLDAAGKLSDTSSAPLACSGLPAGAAPTSKLVPVSFDADGMGAVSLRYPDAGSIRLTALHTAPDGAQIEGDTMFTAAPYRFELSAAAPAGGYVAGAPFALRVAALNKAGASTRGFDAGLLPGATNVSLASCALAPLRNGSVSPAGTADFRDGVASVQLSWSEVGSMGLDATLAGFLGSGIGSSGSSGDCKGIGPFVPAFLQVDRDPAGPARSFDYAGEPIRLVVSARNQQGELTRNWEGATGRSEDVALAAVVSAGGPGSWAAPPAPIAAAAFSQGRAAWSNAYLVGKDVKPAVLAIRASSASASSRHRGENLKTEVRLGRLRLGNRFGGLKTVLSVPVTAEYWTGRSWLLNSDDGDTAIPQGAFAFKPLVAGMQPAPAFGSGPLTLAGGAAAFDLRVSGGPGPVEIAVNLGSGAQDDACIGGSAGSGVATSGAALPWLRPVMAGCGTTRARDPAGRATFGVYAPENRRVIHVREVFN